MERPARAAKVATPVRLLRPALAPAPANLDLQPPQRPPTPPSPSPDTRLLSTPTERKSVSSTPTSQSKVRLSRHSRSKEESCSERELAQERSSTNTSRTCVPLTDSEPRESSAKDGLEPREEETTVPSGEASTEEPPVASGLFK